MSLQFFWPVFLFLSVGIFVQDSVANTNEKKLISALFDTYNKELRPIYYPQDTLTVKFGVALIQLLEFNGKEGYLRTNIWIRMVWKDASLKWNEAHFNNITVLRINPSLVWVPDITLRNAADDQNKIPKRTNVLVYPSGEVLWVPPAVFKTSCSMDATYFPFDKQTCHQKFGSNSFHSKELTLAFYNDKPNADLADYWKSDQWEMVEVPAILNSHSSSLTESATEDITFYYSFRRRLTNYVFTLLLFSILLGVVTLFPFFLPTNKAEKLILELGCLVGALIILTHIRINITTATFSTPLLSKYLLMVLVLNLFSLTSTTFEFYFNDMNKAIPAWIQKYVLEYLGRFLIWDGKSKKKPVGKSLPLTTIEEAPDTNSLGDNKYDGQSSRESTNNEKWKNLTLIIDRVLFVIFTILIVLASVCLMANNSQRIDENKLINKSQSI